MKTTEQIGEDYIKQRVNENRMKKNQKWYSEEEIKEKICVLDSDNEYLLDMFNCVEFINKEFNGDEE